MAILQKMSIFPTYVPLIQSHLGGRVSFLEIVFVGQCEVFVFLDFGHFFFGREAHRSTNGVSVF